VQVGEDERAVPEGLGGGGENLAASAEYRLVNGLELVPKGLCALRLGGLAGGCRLRPPPLGIVCQAAEGGGNKLGLRSSACRFDERDSRGGGLGGKAPDSSVSRDEPGRPREKAGTAHAVEGRPHGDPVAERARDVRAARERARPDEDELPAFEAPELPQGCPCARQLVSTPLEEKTLRRAGLRQAVEIDPIRERVIVAREAAARGSQGLVPDGGQRVDPGEEPLTLLLARRVREPLGRVEGGH
jgi:hypothetical protein